MISADSQRAWIMPGTALVFSVVVTFLAPLYARAFGAAMPVFTHDFFAAYPLWIVFSTAALAITALAEQFPVFARWRALWTGLDMLLNVLSVLIIAGGLIALFLPLLMPPMPD
jgi:hypothetical protein